jgi:hypothetical protein
LDKLKPKIKLSLPMLERLGVLTKKGRHGHHAMELVSQATLLFEILEDPNEARKKELSLLTPAVLTELNFFLGQDILRLFADQGSPRNLCEYCQLIEYGGWNWC